MTTLSHFKKLRERWVALLNAGHHNSTKNQLVAACRDLAFFSTINEMVRVRPVGCPEINPQMWELFRIGYVFRQALAIRRLVDRRKDVCSLGRVVESISHERRTLTRANIVGYDGCPIDPDKAFTRYGRTASIGAQADVLLQQWSDSDHRTIAFDRLVEGANPRSPDDRVSDEVVNRLTASLEHESIERVKGFVNKFVAHADHNADLDDSALRPTFGDIEVSLRILAEVQQFIMGPMLFESSGSLVPIPVYDHIKFLDSPFVASQQVDDARVAWTHFSKTIDGWVVGQNFAERYALR